jgi:hypothetical protein
MEDREAIRREQDEAYEQSLLDDVCKESLEMSPDLHEAVGDEDGASEDHPSPGTLRRLRLLHFQPAPTKTLRRRRSEVEALTEHGAARVSTRTRSTRAQR